MPQMAPMNWILLFFLFLLAYYITNTTVYFIRSPKMKPLKTNYKFNFLNLWKW